MVEHMAQVVERVGVHAGHLCENLNENDDFETEALLV
jgi:hypothetical protein